MIPTDENYLCFVRHFKNINYICIGINILTTAYYMTVLYPTPPLTHMRNVNTIHLSNLNYV